MVSAVNEEAGRVASGPGVHRQTSLRELKPPGSPDAPVFLYFRPPHSEDYLGGFDAFAFDPYNLPSITHAADPLPEVRGALRMPALSLCSCLLRLSSGGRWAIVLGPVT